MVPGIMSNGAWHYINGARHHRSNEQWCQASEQWCQASEQKKAYNDVRYGNEKVSIRIKYGLDLQKFG